MAPAIPFIVAAVTVGGTGYSINRQRAAAQDQKRAARIEQRKARVQNARERRRAAAQAQVQRSQVEAQGAAGAFSTTGQSQQIGALNSQLAGNLSFSQQVERMNQGIISAGVSASQNQTLSAYGQAAASLPGQLGFGLGDIGRSNMAAGKTFWGGTRAPTGSPAFQQGIGAPSNFSSVGSIA